MKLIVGLLALLLVTSQANASELYTFLHHHHFYKPPIVKPPVTSTPTKPVTPGGGGSNWTLCPTPGGWVICAIAIGITIRTYQEIQKGCTSDQENWPARLWMPICGWQDPLSVRN